MDRSSKTAAGTTARRLALAAAALVALAGCTGEGPAIEARPQVITFAPPPEPTTGQASATVSATASSGLPVRYASATEATCSVAPESGLVTALASGTCTVVASQPGDTRYAPAPRATQDLLFRLADTLRFSPAPDLAAFDVGTVAAAASSGAPVRYASATPATCAVDAVSGLTAAVAPGDCTVSATAGALRADLTFAIAAAVEDAVPGAPTAVSASAGEAPGSAVVRAGAVRAGGHALTGYAVTSVPPGASATGAGPAVTVTCPGSCAGYRFRIAASNERGPGPASEAVEPVTRYRVVATFHEPDTQPNDSIFVGRYALNGTTGEVTGLQGRLSESMTGGATPYPADAMTWLDLGHQLSSLPVAVDGVAGRLVTTFRLATTATLSADPRLGGSDGWSPGTGMGLHAGYPGPNPGNAYVRIFVNPADPTAPLTPGQLARLAYADCAPGGMMGASCMTGTAAEVYGTAGTMGGHPASQVTEREEAAP